MLPVPPKPSKLESDTWDSQSAEDPLGRDSLICGIMATLGEGMILIAEMGLIPRAVKLGGFTLLLVGICWLSALFGGTIAALGSQSRSGCLAAVLCLVLPLMVFVLAVMSGGGWKD